MEIIAELIFGAEGMLVLGSGAHSVIRISASLAFVDRAAFTVKVDLEIVKRALALLLAGGVNGTGMPMIIRIALPLLCEGVLMLLSAEKSARGKRHSKKRDQAYKRNDPFHIIILHVIIFQNVRDLSSIVAYTTTFVKSKCKASGEFVFFYLYT